MNDDFRRLLKPPPSWYPDLTVAEDPADPLPAEPLVRVLLRNNGVELDGRLFRACRKSDCERIVPDAVLHCCTPCAVAAEGRYEIDQHMDSCDRRWEERKELLERWR